MRNLQSSGEMIPGIPFAAPTTVTAMTAVPAMAQAGAADFLALIMQSVEGVIEQAQQAQQQTQEAEQPEQAEATPAPALGLPVQLLALSIPEQRTPGTEVKDAPKEPRRKEEEDEEGDFAPAMPFVMTAPATPPPAPVSLAVAFAVPEHSESEDDAEQDSAAITETVSHAQPVPERASLSAGEPLPAPAPVPEGAPLLEHAAAAGQDPLPAGEASRFAVPAEPAAARRLPLAFAARLEQQAPEREAAPVAIDAPAPEPAQPEIPSSRRTLAPSGARLPETPPPAVQVTAASAPNPAAVPAATTAATAAPEHTIAPAAAQSAESRPQPQNTRADVSKQPSPVQGDGDPARSRVTAEDVERRPVPRTAAAARENDPKQGDREQEQPRRTAPETAPAAAKHEIAAAPRPETVLGSAPVKPAAPEHRTAPERAAEPQRLSTVKAVEEPAPAIPSQPAREISLRVSTPRDSDVELRLVERAGEVRVAVRTPDPELAQSLRENLNDLTRALDDHGYRSETWQPAAAGSSSSGDTAQHGRSGESAYKDAREGSSGQSGQQGGEGRRRQQQPAWVEELERHANGEPVSPFRSFFK